MASRDYDERDRQGRFSNDQQHRNDQYRGERRQGNAGRGGWGGSDQQGAQAYNQRDGEFTGSQSGYGGYGR